MEHCCAGPLNRRSGSILSTNMSPASVRASGGAGARNCGAGRRRAMIKSKTQGVGAKARLSDAALVLLTEAANRKDGMVLPAPASLRAKGGVLEKVFGKLLREGLVEEVSVRPLEQAWRSDEN